MLAEAAGSLWAVYSPASGETALLNDESVAILEVLESGPCSTEAVCAELASGDPSEAAAMMSVIEASWSRLIDAGLVRRVDAGRTMPQ